MYIVYNIFYDIYKLYNVYYMYIFFYHSNKLIYITLHYYIILFAIMH